MDPRVRLLLAFGVFLVAAFIERTLAGPNPALGYRINDALDEEAHGDGVRAGRELDAVLDVRPADPASWLRAGRAYTAAGEPSEGAERLRRAVDLDPASRSARCWLGIALMAQYLDADAEKTFEDLFRIKPDHADGLYLYSEIAASRGDARAAVERLEKAFMAGPSDPERYREDTRFDPVRADTRFVRLVRDRRFPSAFLGPMR